MPAKGGVSMVAKTIDRWGAYFVHGLVGATLLLGTPAVTAQAPAAAARESVAATLPLSNDGLLLAGRTEQALGSGDYQLAIRLIEQITQLPSGLVLAPASRTYYPLQRQAARLLGQFPPDGIEFYRQLYDAEVRERFRGAARSGDLVALGELFRVYRLASIWPEIGAELVAHLIDRGDYGEAIEAINELSAAGVAPSRERRAQELVALTEAGAWRVAERVLGELERQSAEPGQGDWTGRVALLRQWFEARRHREHALPGEGASAPARFDPLLGSGDAWIRQISPTVRAGHVPDDATIAEAATQLRLQPLHEPVVADGVLAVRLRGTVWAFDELTLTPRWHVRELAAQSMDEIIALAQQAQQSGATEVGWFVPDDVDRLLADVSAHSVSAAFGLVYTIEPLVRPELGRLPAARRAGQAAAPVLPNALVARELQNGRLAWRTGESVAGNLRGVAFQDCPVAAGGYLMAALQRGEDLRLGVLAPADGRLVLEVPIVGPPTHFPPAGGCCLLAADNASVYVCTGNGVVAALRLNRLLAAVASAERRRAAAAGGEPPAGESGDGTGSGGWDTGAWRWASVYPSSLAQHVMAGWLMPQSVAGGGFVGRPVIAEDLLIVAPRDSQEILALDRFNGRERWRVPRKSDRFMVGVVEAGLVLCGERLTCVDLGDGQTVRWRCAPLNVTGRPVIRGQRVYVPTRDGIVALAGRTGKIVTDQWSEAGRRVPANAANLVVSPAALFGVSPNRIVKYPDAPATRNQCQQRAANQGDDARSGLALAWIDALEGACPAALARLEALETTDETLATERDRLRLDILTGLAQAGSDVAEQMARLSAAAGLATSETDRARVALLAGHLLENAGRWDAALDEYRSVLLGHDLGAAQVSQPHAGRDDSPWPRSADESCRTAAWVQAAARVRDCLPRVADTQAEGFMRKLTEDAAATKAAVALLRRVRMALGQRPQTLAVDVALTLQQPPPELGVAWLPDAGETTSALQPETLRRELHLNRWETHVALGMLPEARADREVWETLGKAESPAAAERESTRVRRIDGALRKLTQAQRVPFGPDCGRRWHIPAAELVVDQIRPTAAMRPWVLLHNHGTRELWLYNTITNTPLRRCADSLTGEVARAQTAQSAVDEYLYGRQAGWQPVPPTPWPAVIHGHLAVVPVRGGVVCVGLGPERQGGKRLWEFAVPEWTMLSAHFAQRVLAGPAGVYLAPKRGEVVCLDWLDGSVLWRHELAGTQIEQLELADDVLVVVGRDYEVAAFDAVFGECLRQPAPPPGVPEAMRVLGDVILVFTDETLSALDARTFVELWRRPYRGCNGWFALPERGWFACRQRAGTAWDLLDARQGGDVFTAGLGDLPEITALVADGGRLLVATRDRGEQAEEAGQVVGLTAFELEGGRRLWSRTLPTLVPLNSSQLAAHATYIPALLLGATEVRGGELDLQSLAIELVEKDSGRSAGRIAIGRHFAGRGDGGVYMLATPTRMIVQAAGTVVAFGNSPLGRSP
ncbi:MAG: PQQ-like beta-propeller repeat protein [Planctomycetes bacterium]|nr:PQQ-like beta-propeller repeat protein [Planctomycetota bacterium]